MRDYSFLNDLAKQGQEDKNIDSEILLLLDKIFPLLFNAGFCGVDEIRKEITHLNFIYIILRCFTGVFRELD